MARMYPLKMDEATTSLAEQQLHEAFFRQLSDEHYVFHSVKWQSLNRSYGARDAEADFVILHPRQGLLLIEVKGGNITIDGESGRWYSNSIEIQNPIEQARRNKYDLIERMGRLPYWSGNVPRIAHAVAFPDVHVRGEIGLEIMSQLVLDRSDFNRLAQWVESAFAVAFGELPSEPLSEEKVKRLIDVLAPSRRLRVGIGGEIQNEERQFEDVTAQQYNLLAFLGNRRRVAIEGCAGSGKTMLAIEQARRLAAQDCKVLFVCFNKLLPARLRTHPSLAKGVDVHHFHGVCEMMAERAGISAPSSVEIDSHYFNVVLPDMLLQAIDALGTQYDAIVVDEGQDMLDHWWEALEFLLRPETGYLYIFFDSGQNLYKRAITLPSDMDQFTLNVNCRNTRRIHAAVAAYYPGDDKPQSHGPEGRNPELVLYADARELHKRLATVLHGLVTDEGVRPEDIVILTQRRLERTALASRPNLGNWKLTQEWPPQSNEIFVTTIHQFKGLESPVVILAEITESEHQNLETMLYVGCSRAKSHLLVFAPESMGDVLSQHLPLQAEERQDRR